MTQKEIVRNMEVQINSLRRGLITIHECETSMTEAILDGILQMPAETAEENDKRIAAVRKLKRRMWKMLLEATK